MVYRSGALLQLENLNVCRFIVVVVVVVVVGPDQSLATQVGPLGRVGQRLLLRGIFAGPDQIVTHQGHVGGVRNPPP